MKTTDNSRMGLNRLSAESRCGVAKPSIPIAIEGYDVKILYAHSQSWQAD